MLPLTVEQTSFVANAAPSRQRAPRQHKSIGGIDVWPAAGGGLLVSLSLPALRASSPVRSKLAGFFLKICPREAHALTIPYVGLDAEGLQFLAAVVGDELDLPNGKISVAERQGDHAPARQMACGDLFKLEWHFRAAASAAKDLVLAEAAYVWGADPQECALRGGRVVHTRGNPSAFIGTFAAGAALQPLARSTKLRCGRRFGISSRRDRKSGFSAYKDAWLGASHSAIDALNARLPPPT